MELYHKVSTETLWREYKEATLSRIDTMIDLADLSDLEQEVLTPELHDKIINQVKYDLFKYIPRYATCFLNSNRRKYYSYYYGITDDGYLSGFPMLNSRMVDLKSEILATFRHLINRHLAIIVPDDRLQYHQKKDQCQLIHDTIQYYQDGKIKNGYSCDKLKEMVNQMIDFQIIPLKKPTYGANQYPKMVFDLRNKLAKNIRDLDNYQRDKAQFQQDYDQWLRRFIYYSSKIDTLSADPVIVDEFLQFLKSSYQLKPDDYCQIAKHGECFQIGNIFLKEPPFLDIFRAFRDFMRHSMRPYQPTPPKRVKDIRKVLLNRLILTGYLLLPNPDISYLTFKMSCRSLQLKDLYQAVYWDGRHWHYQTRILKNGNIPSCHRG